MNHTLELDRSRALTAVLTGTDQPTLVAQPIVNLTDGSIAGYELLSRFTTTPSATPDVWFARADQLGYGPELTARVAGAAVTLRHTLPTGRMDCWLLAEGVETPGELQMLMSLGVPLGQGWLLGRPAEPWSTLAPGAGELILGYAERQDLGDHVAHLVRAGVTARSDDAAGAAVGTVVVGADGRPTAVVTQDRVACRTWHRRSRWPPRRPPPRWPAARWPDRSACAVLRWSAPMYVVVPSASSTSPN